ncbi:MAG: hypothetical protein U1F09_11720 [Steroidobacteraceae bacterium]
MDTNRDAGTASGQNAALRSLALYTLVCFAIFAALKHVLASLDDGATPMREAAAWACGAALLAGTLHVRFRQLPRPTAVMLGFFFATFAFYTSFRLSLPADLGLIGPAEFRIHYRHLVLPALCLLGFWRPGIGALALFAVLAERRTLGAWFGDNLSATEFYPLAEIGLFLVIAAAIEARSRRISFLARAGDPLDPTDTLPLMTKITLAGVSLHLANYFYSAVAKAELGDHPLSWMLHNHTENMIPAHLEFGQLPLSVVPGLAESSFTAFGAVFVLVNALTFFGQGFAILAPLRIRWIIAITAFYDLTHIVIFLVTGIFFYKWILLNLSIIIAFAPLRNLTLPRRLQAYLICVQLAAPGLFYVAHLGWWDTLSVNHERIYAVLDDGSEVEVPTNYWGSFSVTYAQQRRSPELAALLFPTRFGKPKNQRTAELANQCRLPLPPDDGVTRVSPEVGDRDGSISAHVREHHTYQLAHAGPDGRVEFDAYPHHIWSMPWLYPGVYRLDVRRVRAYRFVDEAVCLGFEDGRFQRRVLRTKSFDIPVDR